MRLWTQIISLVISVVTMVLALVPRNYRGEHGVTQPFRMFTWSKLHRFPIFWIGLALLIYVAIQGLNPAWTYETDGKSWWMRQIDPVHWLPAGVQVPFSSGGGSWRAIIIYATAWFTVCAIWVGFTRRRSLQLLLIAIASNGVGLAIFGIVQRFVSNGKIFWWWSSPNDHFFASFIYKNHAGAYLNLVLAVTFGLAAWYYLRGLRRLEKSNPAGVFAFFATIITVSVLVSFARGATLFMLVYVVVAVMLFLIHKRQFGGGKYPVGVALVLLAVLGIFLTIGTTGLKLDRSWSHLARGLAGEDGSLRWRQVTRQASIDMLKDHWQGGTGAGSYRYLFPAYQQYYPEILSFGGKRLVWQHAHNDIVQTPIELGLAGTLLMCLAGVWWLWNYVTRLAFKNTLSVSVLMGLVFGLIYAWWDFPMQCPAVFVLWCTLWPLGALWNQLDPSHR